LGLFQYWPGYAPPPVETTVVVGDYVCQQPAMVDAAGRVLLTFDTVRALFDLDLTWDREAQRCVIPTAGKTLRTVSDTLAAYLSAQPVELNVPVVLGPSGAGYVPFDIFAALYGLRYDYFPESNTVVVDRIGGAVQVASVQAEETYVKETPSLLARKLSRLLAGETVRVYGQSKGSYFVRDPAGRLGWVPSRSLGAAETVIVAPDDLGGPSPPPLDGRLVSLVWEHVSAQNPDPATIGEMPSLNVVSPTWFHVIDSEGTVQNLGDMTYVKWAHERGYQVWGLVTNGFSRSRTRVVLPDPAKRSKIVRQLLYYAKLYDLDGINLDFENFYLSEKDDYVALARELADMAHREGLTVSVDVTFLSSSEVWSRCFDRPALSAVCDYVMVMAYDQHTAGGPAGPVGSLPWVENALQRIVAGGEVPREKLVLGVPFYTRLWAEEPGKNPGVTTYSMKGVKELIADKGLVPVWDSEAGQNYVEYREDGVRYRLWIEDEASMAARVRLVHKYGLAGVAAWRRGFEVPATWEVIRRELGVEG